MSAEPGHKFGHLRNCQRFSKPVNLVDSGGVAARNVDQDVAVDQKTHVGPESAIEFAAKALHQRFFCEW
jgi:hypothetical protein